MSSDPATALTPADAYRIRSRIADLEQLAEANERLERYHDHQAYLTRTEAQGCRRTIYELRSYLKRAGVE